jgi:hypothetical protein
MMEDGKDDTEEGIEKLDDAAEKVVDVADAGSPMPVSMSGIEMYVCVIG